MADAFASRPVPVCPLARCPASGSTVVTPRRRHGAMFSGTAALDHMASFIAGATTTGQRAASSVAVTMSSERPAAIRPTTFAVAGATRISCAQSPSATCGSGEPSADQRPVSASCPVTPWNVEGPTKRIAEGVIATRTCDPDWVRAEARSTTLYAAMPPETSSAMRSPRSWSGTGVGSSGTAGLSLRRSVTADHLEDLARRSVDVVIRDHVVEVGRVLHLTHRDLAPRLEVLRRLASAPLLTLTQLFL